MAFAARTRQGYRRIHGAERRAADFPANCSPPGIDRNHTKPDNPPLGRHRPVCRTLFSVHALALADDRSASFPGTLDSGRMRRRVGQIEIPGIAFWRNYRLLGRQRRSHCRLRVHGPRLESVDWSIMAIVARRRGGTRQPGIGLVRLLARDAYERDSGPLFTSVATVPGQTLARMLDAASRRDFIYLVLFLALFGKSNWFLVLAAAGAPIFFLLLLFLAVRERLQTA